MSTEVESVDFEHAGGRQDKGRRNQGHLSHARHSRDQSTDVVVTESPIERANRKAAFWVGLIGGLSILAFCGVAIWLASGVFRSETRPQIASSRTEFLDNGQNNSQAVIPASVEPTPVVPAPVDPLLRYRWQADHAYVYSVSLDIDQDQDRVITFCRRPDVCHDATGCPAGCSRSRVAGDRHGVRDSSGRLPIDVPSCDRSGNKD